jgi:hypothetical protein
MSGHKQPFRWFPPQPYYSPSAAVYSPSWNTTGFVLALPELLLQPLPLINERNSEYRPNHLQVEMGYYASTCARTILLTELVLKLCIRAYKEKFTEVGEPFEAVTADAGSYAAATPAIRLETSSRGLEILG